MTDWTRFEPEALEGRTAHAHTVEGTCVTGRLARVAGPIDQLVFEGVLQPVLLPPAWRPMEARRRLA